MAKPAPPRKTVSIRGIVFSLAGKEQAYDVYRFARGKRKFEKPNHNPRKP